MRALLAALAIGAVVLGWSELAFWAHPRGDDSVTGIVQAWLAYSLVGFWLLVAVKRYGLRPWWRAVLLGAAYGWVVEGVIVTTTYEDLPLSLVWTALAWHAPLTVLLGLLLAGQALVSGPTRRLAAGAVAVGAVAGVWSAAWRAEDGVQSPVIAIAGWWTLTTVLAVGGYLALSRLDSPDWVPGRPSLLVGAVLLVGWLAVVTAPAFWPAVLASPALVALALAPLELARGRPAGAGRTVLPGRVPPNRAALALIVPGVATAGYALCTSIGLIVPMWVVYLVLTPGGLALALVAGWRAVRSARVVTQPAEPSG